MHHALGVQCAEAHRGQPVACCHARLVNDDEAPAVLPDSLTLHEAFRAAYYLVLDYLKLEDEPSVDLVLLAQFMLSDPARWDDWEAAVRRSLIDGLVPSAENDGLWEDLPPWAR
jgi:hypothetical protein